MNKEDTVTEKPKKEVLTKLETIHQTPREWELVENNPEKILELVQQNLLFKEPTLKNYKGKTLISIKPTSDKRSFIFETSADSSISKDREISIHKFTKDQFFEISFLKNSSKENIHNVSIKELKVAKKNRKLDRFSTKDNPVSGNNFQVAKIDLDIKTALGFSVEVIFSEIDKTLKQKYPFSKVIPLFNRDDLSTEEDLILKNGLPIFITNSLKMESSKDISCFNLKDYYEEEFILDEKISEFRKENIISFLYYPIIFKGEDENVIIGYCYNQSNRDISIGNIEYFSVIAETIIKRIMDSSTALIEEKQSIIDISENGVLIQIGSDYIREALKTKPSFSMDISFKMMTPIRFSLMMKHIYQMNSKTYIGAEITGATSDDRGIEKYREIVRAMSK